MSETVTPTTITNTGKVMRSKIGDYLNVSATSEEDWALIGLGAESLDEEPGAQSESTVYINDDTTSTSITKYETKFPYKTAIIKSEKALMALYKTGRDHLIGTEAEFDYVRVELFEPVEDQQNTFKARKFRVANNVSKFSGAGGEKITIEGTLEAVGDPVEGTFNTSTKTFTATE